jgi:hypothetical protein
MGDWVVMLAISGAARESGMRHCSNVRARVASPDTRPFTEAPCADAADSEAAGGGAVTGACRMRAPQLWATVQKAAAAAAAAAPPSRSGRRRGGPWRGLCGGLSQGHSGWNSRTPLEGHLARGWEVYPLG